MAGEYNTVLGNKRVRSLVNKAALYGLAALLRDRAHALHDYFRNFDGITIVKLSLTEQDFETLHVRHAKWHYVRESAAVYAIGGG